MLQLKKFITAELFRRKVPFYSDRFKENLRDGLTLFFKRVQDTTNELVKERLLGLAKSIDVNFKVMERMSQALENEVSHPRTELNLFSMKSIFNYLT